MTVYAERRAVTPNQAHKIIRREAKRRGQPFERVKGLAKIDGLTTPEGRVLKAGHWFVETIPCTCLRQDIPDPQCLHCHGRGCLG